MRAVRALLFRLTGLWDKGRKDREMAEELESHLAMQIEENRRSGMTPEHARRAALLKSGGLEPAKEACRDRRGLPVLEMMIRDLTFALRQARRSPGFTAVAVIAMALGIGANTAIFSVIDRVLLRPLPYSGRSPTRMPTAWSRWSASSPTGPHARPQSPSSTSGKPPRASSTFRRTISRAPA